MDSGAPLWRIVLSILVLFLAVQRVAAAVMLGIGEAGPLVVAIYAVQAAGALFLWVALRWFARLVIPATVTAGVLFGASAMAGMAGGVIAADVAFIQVVMAALATAAFAFLLKRGLEDDRRRREHH